MPGLKNEYAPFPTREALEAAHEEAARVGPRPGILAASLLPPLVYSNDVVAAFACLPTQYYCDDWAEVPLEQIDRRAPWRRIDTSIVNFIRGLGFLWVRPYPPGSSAARPPFKGWKAVMLGNQTYGVVTEHILVSGKSRRPVRFDDLNHAIRNSKPSLMLRACRTAAISGTRQYPIY